MTENNKQVGFMIDEATWETALDRLEHGEMSEKLRLHVAWLAYGDQYSERQKIRADLTNARDKRRKLTEEVQRIETDIHGWEGRISELEGRLSEIDDIEGEYKGALQVIEHMLREGARAPPDHVQIKRAAEIKRCDPDQVIQDLKERNPNVPERAFQWAADGESANWKETKQQI